MAKVTFNSRPLGAGHTRLRFDRQFWVVIAITAAILGVRAVYLARCLTETVDESYHLTRGLAILQRDRGLEATLRFNDPPVGEMIVAFPLLVQGIKAQDLIAAVDHAPAKIRGVGVPELRLEIYLWKSVLALPLFAVVFAWSRAVYDVKAGWLAWFIALIDPTLAAHLPLATLDVLAVTAIVIAVLLCWQFAQEPTIGRWFAAVVATVFALGVKSTGAALPPTAMLLCVCQWLLVDRRWLGDGAAIRARALMVIASPIAVSVFFWPLTLFDSSPLHIASKWEHIAVLHALSVHAIPGGVYWNAVMWGLSHDRTGNPAMLLGQTGSEGWWYYFPVVATYKVPLGIGALFFMAMGSLTWRRVVLAELPMALAALSWAGLAIESRIDIGFRHFLPAYVFLLMLMSRCVAGASRRWDAIAWTCAGIVFADTLRFGPDLISYVNFPRRAAYYDISDSNIDWGQSLNEVGAWLGDNPPSGRHLYIGYFGPETDLCEFFGDKVTAYFGFWTEDWRGPADSRALPLAWMPDDGILIISPIMLTGQYDRVDRFAVLRHQAPIATIGHSMLVYDLDELKARGIELPQHLQLPARRQEFLLPGNY